MTRPLSVFVLSLVVVLAVPGVSATARAAAGDGVQVDPDSAPAKEYALPLDSARAVAGASGGGGASGSGGASGGSGASRGGGAPATGSQARPPAFGSGITAKRAAAPTGSSARGEAPAAGGGDSSRADASDAKTADRRVDVPASEIDAGASPILYSLGGALAVLLAGGLVALTLRRRQPTA